MARNSRPSDQDEATSSADATAEHTRESLAQVAQSASTLLQGAQAFQQVQLQMLQRVALAQQQAAEKLRSATTPAEMLAVQGQLMLQGWQEAMQYSQELMAALMKVQGEMLGRNAQPTAGRGAAPVTFQAWQNVMLDALNGAAGRQH